MSADEPRYKKLMAAYANYFEVGHNAFEFLFNFGQVDPQSGEINVNSRIAVGPAHAKLFLQLIENAISQFETEFGVIPELQGDDTSSSILDFTPDLERRAINMRRQRRTSSGISEVDDIYGKAYQKKTDKK